MARLGVEPDIATNPDLEMQVGMIGESGRGKEAGACWGLDETTGKTSDEESCVIVVGLSGASGKLF